MSDKAYLAALHRVDELKRQRDQLREALKTATNIIDKMGDMSDGEICPIVWSELKCEDAIEKARAALAATEEPAQ